MREKVLLVAGLCVSIGLGVYIARTANESHRSLPAPTRELNVGDTLGAESIAGHVIGRRSIVLFARSGCKFCTDSMDFYRRIAATPGRLPFIIVTTDRRDVFDAYLRQHGLAVDEVVVTDSKSSFPPTPTLLVVEADTKIAMLWKGQLREAQQEARVLEAVAAGSAN